MVSARFSPPVNPGVLKAPIVQSSGRFGAGKKAAEKAVLSSLREQFPQADAFWQGNVLVKDRDGNAVPASIRPTQPEDAQQVDRWYEPKSDGRVWYHNPKWRTWWQQKIAPRTKTNRDGTEATCKLVVGDNLILGVVNAIRNFPNPFGPGTITKAQGIRINPECIKIDPTDQSVVNEKPLYSGVGSALIHHIVIKSLQNGDRGFGGNSTLGAEGFYHKLGFPHRTAEDGYRTYFYTDPKDNLTVLARQFARYQTMHDASFTTQQQRNGNP